MHKQYSEIMLRLSEQAREREPLNRLGYLEGVMDMYNEINKLPQQINAMGIPFKKVKLTPKGGECTK